MNTKETAKAGALQLARVLDAVSAEQIDALMDEICAADKIFVHGVGRSMLMLRCFAMRLMHLGFACYVVGDTTTPAFGPGDLLISGSGSGETHGAVSVAEKAKKLGGRVAAITIKKESSLGRLADAVVEIPAYTDKIAYEGMENSVLPGSGLFEMSIMIIGDAMVVPLGERMNIPTDRAFALHANLE